MIAVIDIDFPGGTIVTIGRTCEGYTYNGEPAWYTIEGESHQMKYCTIVVVLDVATFEEAREKFPEWLV